MAFASSASFYRVADKPLPGKQRVNKPHSFINLTVARIILHKRTDKKIVNAERKTLNKMSGYDHKYKIYFGTIIIQIIASIYVCGWGTFVITEDKIMFIRTWLSS